MLCDLILSRRMKSFATSVAPLIALLATTGCFRLGGSELAPATVGPSYTLSRADAVTRIISGSAHATPLELRLMKDGVFADGVSSGSVSLSAHGNASCSSAASGSLLNPLSPVTFSTGIASFAGLNFSWLPARYEGDVYFKASASAHATSLCFGPVAVLQRFNAGVGGWHGGTPSVTGEVGADQNDSFSGAAIDSSGRIVAVGKSVRTSTSLASIFLRRFLPDGTLDSSFGTGGTLLPFGVGATFGATFWDTPTSISIDSAGRYVVGGMSRLPVPAAGGAARTRPMIWRFLSSGALDTSFNAAVTPGYRAWLPTLTDAAANMYSVFHAIDSEGRIVQAGSALWNDGSRSLVVWRTLSDGTPDLTFGAADGTADGAMVWARPGGGPPVGAAGGTGARLNDEPQALSLAPDGGILLFGYSATNDADGRQRATVWRLTSDGAADTSFGTNGAVVFGALSANVAGKDMASAGTVDAHGNIFVLGLSEWDTGPWYNTLHKLNSAGAVDATFGTGGVVSLSAAPGAQSYAYTLKLDAAGGILIGGQVNDVTGSTGWPLLLERRLASTGAVDTAFATNGRVPFPTVSSLAGGTGVGLGDYASRILIDSRGRLVVVGYSSNASSSDGYYTGLEDAIWRFKANGQLDL